MGCKKIIFHLSIGVSILCACIFFIAVTYFSEQEKKHTLSSVSHTDYRPAPAVFEGFIPRWNAQVQKAIEREIYQLTHSTTPLTQKENDQLARLRHRLNHPHIQKKSATELPKNLSWEDGMNEPEIGSPQAKKGGTVRIWASTPFPNTLRPFGPNSDSFFNYTAIDNIWMPLVRLHPITKHPIRGLADKWAISGDKKTVYYHLDHEATYSDGRPVQAEDFLLNICLRTSNAARDPYWNSRFQKGWAHICLYGDKIIALTLDKPCPLIAYVAAKDITPAHPGFYHDFNELYPEKYQWKATPNTGAYIIQAGKIRPGERIPLIRVKNWWAKDKKFDRYRFNADTIDHVFVSLDQKAVEMLRRRELDILHIRRANMWENKLEIPEFFNGIIEKHHIPAQGPQAPYGLYINCAHPLLKQLEIRKGLCHALNIDKVIKTLFRNSNKRLNSYMDGYGSLSLPLAAPEYSREKALVHFRQAGYTQTDADGILMNAKGDRLSFELTLAEGSTTMNSVCALLREEALKCGVELKLDTLNYQVCSRKVFEKRHQIVFWAWPLSTPFPNLYQTFSSELAYDAQGQPIPNTNNLFSVADKELDAALNKERQASDFATLQSALHQAQKRIHELHIWVPGWGTIEEKIATHHRIRWPKSGNNYAPELGSDPVESHFFWVDDKHIATPIR